MPNKSKGLGDTIEKFTSSTGIKSLTKSIFGEDCGCDARQDYLNKKFPYKLEYSSLYRSITQDSISILINYNDVN